MSQCPSSRSTEVEESKLSLTRRNLFSSIAIAAGALGLSGVSSSAQAASKKYKVCATKDIKVGGGSIFRISSANIMVLVTQPKKDEFRAFNPACTHRGFQISQIQGKNMVCPIHGAMFDTTTGAVQRGPAQIPLKKYTLTVENKALYVTLSK